MDSINNHTPISPPSARRRRAAPRQKELGLFDLGSRRLSLGGNHPVGWAASSVNTRWSVLAIVTFYLPLAAVVIFSPGLRR
jgi:hypothetical protein